MQRFDTEFTCDQCEQIHGENVAVIAEVKFNSEKTTPLLLAYSIRFYCSAGHHTFEFPVQHPEVLERLQDPRMLHFLQMKGSNMNIQRMDVLPLSADLPPFNTDDPSRHDGY